LNDKKADLKKRCLDKLQKAWLSDDKGFMDLLITFLDFIQSCISFCWNGPSGIPLEYYKFSKGLKIIPVLH
jgi:hypothetical protein